MGLRFKGSGPGSREETLGINLKVQQDFRRASLLFGTVWGGGDPPRAARDALSSFARFSAMLLLVAVWNARMYTVPVARRGRPHFSRMYVAHAYILGAEGCVTGGGSQGGGLVKLKTP